jgi:hypothetical protein
MARFTSLVLLGAAVVTASPLAAREATTVTVTAPAEAAATAWDSGAVPQFPIHASCNATQHQYIRNGLEETLTISRQARDHILRWGNSSAIYQKYFGNAPTGEPIGWFTKIVDGDKAGVLFRCDDPDQNCATQSSKCIVEIVLLSASNSIDRLGWPLARRQRIFRDCDLRPLVCSPPSLGGHVHVWIRRRQRRHKLLLGIRPSASPSARPQGWRGYCRALRRRRRVPRCPCPCGVQPG